LQIQKANIVNDMIIRWVYIYLRIMQVMPLGQKNPSQHVAQSAVLTGMSFEFLRSTFLEPALQAHPGSHPETHEDKLQFLLGFK
jgi:hypothetical protein